MEKPSRQSFSVCSRGVQKEGVVAGRLALWQIETARGKKAILLSGVFRVFLGMNITM
jgi:hypothetical protein